MWINESQRLVLRCGAGVLVFAFVVDPCSAARVYQFVDYPAYQKGYTFAGTITTTDDAPLDSVLDEAEIVDWHINTAGQYPLVASRYQYPLESTEVHGIRISESAIELPLAVAGDVSPGWLRISESTPSDGRGSYDYRLIWTTQFESARGTLLSYAAFTLYSDVLVGHWYGDISAPSGSNWPIATAVPEPATLGLVFLGLHSVLSLRLRGRRCVPS